MALKNLVLNCKWPNTNILHCNCGESRGEILFPHLGSCGALDDRSDQVVSSRLIHHYALIFKVIRPAMLLTFALKATFRSIATGGPNTLPSVFAARRTVGQVSESVKKSVGVKIEVFRGTSPA
jgi:hypothetical protein